ncbi:MAG: right-handed parallel beta-helix repeat-containing protein [Deltaproteobacteria bacterium]|nr:right-handed parallel beta-helix repeat-containing protein [Deltaproteobacteria bacterium]
MARLHQRSKLLALLWLPLAGLPVGCGDDSETTTTPGSTLYVDETAAEEGDGSAEHPFRTVRQALEVDRPFDTISVAPGAYPIPSPWTVDATLRVVGASAEETTLEAEPGSARIEWASTAALTFASLGFTAPLNFADGQLDLANVAFSGAVGPALAVDTASARLQQVTVSEVIEVAGQAGSGDGVTVTGGTFEWTGGSTTDVPDRGLVLLGTTATLADLTLASVTRAPLTVSDGASVTAQRITIAEVNIAVFVDEASLELTESTISGAATAGLLASPGSTTTVTDSAFTDCPEGHVALIGSAASLTLERNSFKNATNNVCVSAAQTSGLVVIRDNQIDGCAGGGITLSGLSGAVVEGNDVRNITPDPIFQEIADGISLLDGQATFTGNTVVHTDGYGISFIRGRGTIDGNVVGPVDGVGISIVEPGAERVVVSGNTVTEAQGAGVMVLQAEADVTNNTISETIFLGSEGLGDGIAFGLGADVHATGNQIWDNGTNGIVFLDGVTGELTGNTLTDNNLYGIKEHCTALNQVTIGTNVFSGNGLGETDLCSP